MQLAIVSTEFAEYCRRHPRHPSCHKAVRLIEAEVEVIPGSEFTATGNGGGEQWVRVRSTDGRTIELAMPRKCLKFRSLAVQSP